MLSPKKHSGDYYYATLRIINGISLGSFKIRKALINKRAKAVIELDESTPETRFLCYNKND